MNRQTLLLISFGYALSDSLITYLLAGRSPFNFSVNSIVALFVLLIYFAFGAKKVVPPLRYFFPLTVFVLLYFFGLAIETGNLLATSLKAGSMITAFVLGYSTIRNVRTEKSLYVTIYIVSAAYTIIGLMAVLEIAPNIFPVTKHLGVLGGELVNRLEVTTDPNMQICYTVASATLMVVARTKKVLLACLFLVGSNLFLFSELQSRSGMILYVLAIIVSFYLFSAKYRVAVRAGIWALSLAICLVLLANYFDTLISFLSKIILRFTVSDYDTLGARTQGMYWFLKSVIDPRFWLPLDPLYFRRNFGIEPHFSPAVILLKTGLIGVVCWVMTQIAPLCRVLALIFHKKSRGDLTVFVGVTASIVIIASLAMPMASADLLWLWAGCCCGLLERPTAKPKMLLANNNRRKPTPPVRLPFLE